VQTHALGFHLFNLILVFGVPFLQDIFDKQLVSPSALQPRKVICLALISPHPLFFFRLDSTTQNDLRKARWEKAFSEHAIPEQNSAGKEDNNKLRATIVVGSGEKKPHRNDVLLSYLTISSIVNYS
jgi:hypothetical protein